MTPSPAKSSTIPFFLAFLLIGCGDDSTPAEDDAGGGSSGTSTGGTAGTAGTAGSAGMATGGSGGGTIFPTPEGELFRDDFEAGNRWDVTQGTCSIQADESSVFTCELGTNEARAVAGDIWGEYSVQARVRINELEPTGGRRIYLAARFADSNNWYGAALYDGGPFEVQIRKKSAGTSSDLARAPYPIEVGTWYTIKLEVKGSSLKLYMNDVLQISAEDTEFNQGRIALLVDRTNASWDDVLVTNP